MRALAAGIETERVAHDASTLPKNDAKLMPKEETGCRFNSWTISGVFRAAGSAAVVLMNDEPDLQAGHVLGWVPNGTKMNRGDNEVQTRRHHHRESNLGLEHLYAMLLWLLKRLGKKERPDVGSVEVLHFPPLVQGALMKPSPTTLERRIKFRSVPIEA